MDSISDSRKDAEVEREKKIPSQTKSKYHKHNQKPPAIKIWFYLGETCSPLFDFRVIRFEEDVL